MPFLDIFHTVQFLWLLSTQLYTDGIFFRITGTGVELRCQAYVCGHTCTCTLLECVLYLLHVFCARSCVLPSLLVEESYPQEQTWQYSKSKQWSCKDFVVMRQRDRKLCLDVATRRGTYMYYNTDHHLVLARLKIWHNRHHRKSALKDNAQKTGRYDVGKLMSKDSNRQEMCDQYHEQVVM